MEDWPAWITAGSSAVAAVSIVFAGAQLVQSKNQARSQFEDDLVAQYRAIVSELPIKALLGDPITSAELDQALPAFYRYFEFCNEQVFLWDKNRIREDTWNEWRAGILGNVHRHAFKDAWRVIDDKIEHNGHRDFQEFRTLLADNGGEHSSPPGARDLR